MKKFIFLDMDGVLADFGAEIIRRFGKPFEHLGDTAQDRWDIIGSNCAELYANLNKVHDADELVRGVTEYCNVNGYTPAVLTALPTLLCVPEAFHHKQQWIKQHYPMLLSNFYIGPYSVHKQVFAQPGRILIDDRLINITQWNEAGGVGIHHLNADETLTNLNTIIGI